MKVIIAGSRDFDDYELMKKSLKGMTFITEVVNGGARGADTLGGQFGIDNGMVVKLFPAQWEKYGKKAGHIRNTQMAEYADMLIAFWDGMSKGTAHMIKEAKKRNLEVLVINYKLHEWDW